MPSREALFKHGVLTSPICAHCNEVVETSSHIFMECQWSQMVWFASPLGIRFDDRVANGILFKDWLADIIINAEPDVVELVLSISYGIWFARNKLCFEQVDINISQVVSKAITSLQEYKSRLLVELALFSVPDKHDVSTSHSWIPPPINCYKLNVDAAGPLNDKWGIGAIIRDNEGEVMAAGRWLVPCLNDATVAEAVALRTGLQFAIDLFLLHIHAETDSSIVAAALNSGSNNKHYMELIIQDCRRLRDSFASFSCNHVKRNANQVAHGLAKSALASGDRIWMKEILDCISNIISHDISLIPVE